MKKLSRREIEQSVKSKAEPSLDSVRIKDTPSSEQNLRRRSRVLGGNLAGIKKKKRSTNPLWWLSIAGFIILSGLVFIIPAFTDDAPKIAQNKQKIAIDSIYEDSRIEEPNEEPKIESSDNFTLTKDRDRAKEYRENDAQEKQINTLKQQAQKAIASGNYTSIEDGAYGYFKKIQELDANNSFARKGVNYLINRLHTLGMSQVESSNLRAARSHLASLFSIDSDSEKYVDLANAVSALEVKKETEKQQKEIDKILAKAENAIVKKRFTTPEKDNALNYYREVLEKDENNLQAKEGIQSVINFYIQRANESITSEDWEKATQSINILKSPLDQATIASELEEKMALAKQLPAGQRTLATTELATSQTLINESSTDNSPVSTSGTLTQELEGLESSDTQQTSSQETTTTQNSQTFTNNGSIDQTIPTQSEPVVPKLAPTQDRSIASTAVPEREVFQSSAPVIDIQSGSSNRINSQSQQRQSDQNQLQAGLQAYYNSEYITAFSNLAPLAEKNNTRAQIRVGYMYQFGRGVEKNETIGSTYLQNALPSLKKLANQSQAWAQSDLGSLYEDGIVVTQSYSEALIWYRRAAAQNYTGAQTNLGNMYFFGKGVDQSQTEAIRWYRLAAAGGDAIAKQNLIQLGALDL